MMLMLNPAHPTRVAAVRILLSMQHKKPDRTITHCQSSQARLSLDAGAIDPPMLHLDL